MVMRRISDDTRPKTPVFATTRGYNKGLWEMTITCWKEDPIKRPTVDYVPGVLRGAAGQWESKHGELVTPPPRYDPPQPPGVETPAPVLAPISSVSVPSVPRVPSKSTRSKEETKPTLPKEELLSTPLRRRKKAPVGPTQKEEETGSTRLFVKNVLARGGVR